MHTRKEKQKIAILWLQRQSCMQPNKLNELVSNKSKNITWPSRSGTILYLVSSTSQFFSDSSEQDVMTASKQRCKDDVGALSMAKEEQDNDKMACKNQPWARHVVVMESTVPLFSKFVTRTLWLVPRPSLCSSRTQFSLFLALLKLKIVPKLCRKTTETTPGKIIYTLLKKTFNLSLFMMV